MNVEVWFRPPVLIKNELVRIVVANVKVVLYAALFRARRLHEFAQRGEKIITLLRLALQNGDQKSVPDSFRFPPYAVLRAGSGERPALGSFGLHVETRADYAALL